jgi:hypothetical protein
MAEFYDLDDFRVARSSQEEPATRNQKLLAEIRAKAELANTPEARLLNELRSMEETLLANHRQYGRLWEAADQLGIDPAVRTSSQLAAAADGMFPEGVPPLPASITAESREVFSPAEMDHEQVQAGIEKLFKDFRIKPMTFMDATCALYVEGFRGERHIRVRIGREPFHEGIITPDIAITFQGRLTADAVAAHFSRVREILDGPQLDGPEAAKTHVPSPADIAKGRAADGPADSNGSEQGNGHSPDRSRGR